MKVVKQIVKVVWPIVYKQLSKLAEKTETEWDDITLDAISYAVMAWIESEDQEDE